MISSAQLAQLRAKATTAAETVFPASIELPGCATGTVDCAGGRVEQLSGDLLAGGVLVGCALAFRVRKALLDQPPKMNHALVYLGVTWKIVRVIDSPHDPAYFIGADSDSK